MSGAILDSARVAHMSRSIQLRKVGAAVGSVRVFAIQLHGRIAPAEFPPSKKRNVDGKTQKI
jgi:hypothetical protein